jgi:hypothetical protein
MWLVLYTGFMREDLIFGAYLQKSNAHRLKPMLLVLLHFH